MCPRLYVGITTLTRSRSAGCSSVISDADRSGRERQERSRDDRSLYDNDGSAYGSVVAARVMHSVKGKLHAQSRHTNRCRGEPRECAFLALRVAATTFS